MRKFDKRQFRVQNKWSFDSGRTRKECWKNKWVAKLKRIIEWITPKVIIEVYVI